ncbi:MAG TPA: hypothetical protein VGG33_03110 [Polyangia bacterium]
MRKPLVGRWLLLAGALASGCLEKDPPPSMNGGNTGNGRGGSSGSGGSSESGGSNGSGGNASGGNTGNGTGGSNGGGGSGGGGSGGGGAGGSSSPDGGGSADANPVPMDDPMLLSKTGLYADIAKGTLAPGVHPFTPLYPLWSDTAAKKRWIALPPDTKIDTFKMDFWDYPSGTRLWKEFERDGVRVETRLLLKRSPGVWFAMAYKWNREQTEATAVPMGENNALGTQHDIPSKEKCSQCHSQMQDWVLGFSAVQLSHGLEGLTLDKVKSMGWLSDPPAGPVTLPGDETAKAALGYLHSNCGMCHNEGSKPYSVGSDIDLWAHADLLKSVETTRAYLSMVCATWKKSAIITECPTGQATGTPMHSTLSAFKKRVTPGVAAMSGVHDLMSLREGVEGAMKQMPPVGTEIPDPAGLKAVDEWINRLPKAPATTP